jgi:hypothetical protein
MFEMLYGYPPFHSKNKDETFEKIRKKQLIFKDDVRDLSKESKDLISRV